MQFVIAISETELQYTGFDEDKEHLFSNKNK